MINVKVSILCCYKHKDNDISTKNFDKYLTKVTWQQFL